MIHPTGFARVPILGYVGNGFLEIGLCGDTNGGAETLRS